MCDCDVQLVFCRQSPGLVPLAPSYLPLLCVPTQFAEPLFSAKRTAHASHCPGSVMGSLTVSTEVTRSSARKVGGAWPGIQRETKWVSGRQPGPPAHVFGKSFCPLVQILTTYKYACLSVHASIRRPASHVSIHPSSGLSNQTLSYPHSRIYPPACPTTYLPIH